MRERTLQDRRAATQCLRHRTGVFQKKREICHLAGLIAERQEKRDRSLLSLCLIVKV